MTKPGRNDPCPCGSGKKSKHCCGGTTATRAAAPTAARSAAAAGLVQLAQQALRAGDFPRAVAAMERLLPSAPDDPALLGDLGMVYAFVGRLRESVAVLRRAIALRPASAITHHRLAVALQQSGDDAGALLEYARAADLSPKLAEAHAHMGDLLLPMGRAKEAVAAYQKAYASAPETTLGLLCRAKSLVVRDRPDEAEQRLRELVARDPSSSEAHLVLALLLAEKGRFDDAAVHYERCLALSPRMATAYNGLVVARKLTEADRPLVDRILARLDAGDVAERHRMTLHFAAGKALDDLRDHAAAIVHFDAANAIRRRLAPFDRARLVQLVDRTIARYTRAFFDEHAALGDPDPTPVLVLGMPRSGTTLVERFLSSHPSVAGGGELTFWGARAGELVDAPVDAVVRAAPTLRRDYLEVLRGIGPDALRVTDKMPFNFFWIGLVHTLFPGARFVHCRRSPLDTCLSVYQTHFAKNWGFASDRGDLAFYYRQYLRMMEHWRAALPPDRLLEVDYEEATRDPEATARRLVAFCDLPWDDACLRPDRNADVVKTASKWQARQPVYRTSVERWRNYEPWLGELAELRELLR